MIGEYERAFYGSQYAAMAPLFEHYGVQLWMPAVGGRVDYQSGHDENTMTILGLSSKREITRTSSRVRTAMAVQTREQGRYLGGRPPYGYRLVDAGPHPDKAHEAKSANDAVSLPGRIVLEKVAWVDTKNQRNVVDATARMDSDGLPAQVDIAVVQGRWQGVQAKLERNANRWTLNGKVVLLP